ncbi:MAG: glycosyltransferase family 4 protein [Acidobacteriota bacterium]
MSEAGSVVILWQRFLPYHRARLLTAARRLEEAGFTLHAVEVASQDTAYGFRDEGGPGIAATCCFKGRNYHDLMRDEVYGRVLTVLRDISPDVVFAPAAAFPEGMAAYAYRLESGGRAVLMDVAWEATDHRGRATRFAKRAIHRNIEAAFIPAESHRGYFEALGFPRERILFGVDAVDNDAFRRWAEGARGDADGWRARLGLPEDFVLFVGRMLARKGVSTLLESYGEYRAGGGRCELVLVGEGPEKARLQAQAQEVPGVHWLGQRFGEELGACLGLARVLVVPSLEEPWGLVVNEGAAAGLPLIVSDGVGARATLLKEGANGWAFPAGDAPALCACLREAEAASSERLKQMGRASQEIVGQWGLDRFADGVMQALQIPRRPPAGFISNWLTRHWKGRMQIT